MARSKAYVKLNAKAVNDLLHSQAIHRIVDGFAQQSASNGDGEIKQMETNERYMARVYTNKQDNRILRH